MTGSDRLEAAVEIAIDSIPAESVQMRCVSRRGQIIDAVSAGVAADEPLLHVRHSADGLEVFHYNLPAVVGAVAEIVGGGATGGFAGAFIGLVGFYHLAGVRTRFPPSQAVVVALLAEAQNRTLEVSALAEAYPDSCLALALEPTPALDQLLRQLEGVGVVVLTDESATLNEWVIS